MPTAQQQLLATRLNFGFNVQKYIDQAIRSGVQDVAAYAEVLIYRSPEFRVRFPGIFKPDGTLRISPQAYVAYEEQFASTAASFGFGLTRAQVGGLISQGVDPGEFKTRAQAIQTVQTNPDTFQFLKQQIADINRNLPAGQPKIPQLNTLTDAVNFLTGRADVTVYQAYEAAELQAAAKQAGIELGGYEARQIAKQTESVLTPAQAEESFAKIAARMREAGPELAGFLGAGYESALRTIEFGGPGRVGLALKAEQALKQAEAALKATAAPQLRLAGGRPVTGETAEAGF